MKWNYNGDINLEHGGFFYQEPDDSGVADHVYIVEVLPVSHFGGPDNAFIIDKGSVYIGTDPVKHAEFLATIGGETGSRLDLILGAMAYRGIESDYREIVMIGKPTPYDQAMPHGMEIDKQLRGNWKLKNYVRRAYLD